MLYNSGYKHTFILLNAYCFSVGNSGYANAARCYIYTYIACLVRLWSETSGVLSLLLPTHVLPVCAAEHAALLIQMPILDRLD